MKVICLALLALFSVGCSSTCKDGTGSFFVWNRGNYHACEQECHGADTGEKKECRCSNACPCWKKHH